MVFFFILCLLCFLHLNVVEEERVFVCLRPKKIPRAIRNKTMNVKFANFALYKLARIHK